MRRILRHIRESLALKLDITVLVLSVLIFGLSLGVLYQHSGNAIKKEAVQRATILLHTTAQRLASLLGTIETATNATSWMITEHWQPDSLLAFTRRIVALNANVNGCSITAEPNEFPQYGRYFSAYTIREGDSITTVREKPYDYHEKVWYKTAHDHRRASWVDPFDDFQEGTLYSKEMIASYSMPLYNAKGRLLGVIATDVALSMLANTIDVEKPSPNAYFLMLGKDGHYFVHPDSTRIASQTIFSGLDVNRQSDLVALGYEMTLGTSGVRKVNVEGKPCYVCFEPVPGTMWSIAFVCPERDMLQRYNHLGYILVPLIAIGLLVIMLLCRRIVKQAISPLSQLVEKTQRLAEGHYDEPIIRTTREDAVGQLQNSFSQMQESLNRHIGEINRANADRIRRNEELIAARRQAEEAARQKMAFIQNMSHQIRTPLNIIMGFAQVLQNESGSISFEEAKPIASMMDHNAKTLTRMVAMLYDSSDTGRRNVLRMVGEEISCNELARRCILYIKDHFPDLTVTLDTSVPDSLKIRSYIYYLERSIRELLFNSAKYSDGEHICLRVSAKDDKVVFITEDTGPGISEDNRIRMFDSFVKIDDLSEGLGLGLPLVKQHIATLRGELTLDNEYKKGCRFIIVLPKDIER